MEVAVPDSQISDRSEEHKASGVLAFEYGVMVAARVLFLQSWQRWIAECPASKDIVLETVATTSVLKQLIELGGRVAS
jgi:hypothetical protein